MILALLYPTADAPASLTPVANGGNPPDACTSLTLRYRPWRLPLGEDRAGSL
ncbi:hypothetical protein [uncultured Nostoc sp.]|uniref:hypothetical protein n=1 Tax=uncultured Nostoc sp. TaxID=340711 RepID=UPI0035CA87EF